MGRINSYPNVTRLSAKDELIVDGSAGTRNITIEHASSEIMSAVSGYQRRNIWRGKDFGDSLTTEQKAAISEGTFDDMYIGDYWTINGTIFQIVDFDYWYQQGDTACTSHHLVIMPNRPLYSTTMNDADTTEGGYALSKMRTEGLNEAKNIINSAFGASNILKHREYISNAVSNGHVSANGWVDSTVELPNEVMMYGCFIRTAMNTGDPVTSNVTLAKSQLSAMRIRSLSINPYRNPQWLRDVISSGSFAVITYNGLSSAYTASSSAGVRPVFGVIGDN